QTPPDAAIESMVQERVDRKQAVGLVVATLERGKTKVFTAGGSGTRTVQLGINTVFEIGSITKVFTAALLADMVARGEVRLEDPVGRYLPSFVRVPTRKGKRITLLDLATQFSGLPRLPENLNPRDPTNPYADYTVDQLYAFLSGYQLTRDIGEQFEYSNLGLGLLGHALALRAGKSYEQLLRERILDPLDMKDTRIVLSRSMQSRLSPGHDEQGVRAGNWDLPTLAGAGALRSTAGDMLKFLAANLQIQSTPLTRALAMTRGARRDIGGPMKIGLGWQILNPFGRTIVWHNGGTGGYRAFIGLDAESQRGAVVLSNQSVSADDIGLHILEPRLPLTPPPKVRHEIAVDSLVLESYVGVYQVSPAFEIAITREASALSLQATGQEKVRMFAESPTSFFLKIVDAQVTFEKDASGRVTRLILHQAGATIPGVKK
ncbi:MAG: serine hydrolase, partial [Gemmatimonadota bacterium]|nr:serine hydrolase [Gemmatimonadota bacterium]